MDEGVTEGLQSIQGTPNTTGHMEEDERYKSFFFSPLSFFKYKVAFLQCLTFTMLFKKKKQRGGL